MTRVNHLGEAKMKKTLAIGTLLLILALTTLTIPKNVSANTTGDIAVTDQTGQQTILTHDQIVAMPSVTEEAILSCYGSQVAAGDWTGVNLSELLNFNTSEAVGGSIAFTAQDGYQISIPMETAVKPDVILAYAFNSLPLQETYRLVVPEANGNTWIALVVSITVSDNAAPNVIGRNVDVFDAVQEFTKNTPQNTPSTTPVPTIKPITPTPQPSIPASITPTISPTNTTASPTTQSTTQSNLPPETLYIAVAGIIAVLIVVSLVAVRQKKPKP
jgi:DMSO/TMAO reductase YedYZ molybdopterin-dependent catalytic subunit